MVPLRFFCSTNTAFSGKTVLVNKDWQKTQYLWRYKNLQINPVYGEILELSGQIISLCKAVVSSRKNRVVMHRDVPVASLRRCVKSRSLDKSDRTAKS